jgi:hypothetical protein
LNFSKHSFTLDEFFTIPVYEEARLAPVETPFLLKGRMSAQQDYVRELVTEFGEEGIRKQLKEVATLNKNKNNYLKINLKITFWWRYKDGHVQDRGGHIKFIEKLEVVGDKVVINIGDDTKFEHIKLGSTQELYDSKEPLGG